LGRFRLDGRVAAVTGGAGGIGLASAQALAEAGARIVLLDHDGAALERAAAGIEGARAVALDVTDESGVAEAFARIPDIAILVNAAGIALRHAAVEHPLADWDKVVAVNMTGTFLCARAAGKAMIARGQGGSIVNIASIMGLSGGGIYPNISYQSSKGAIINMTRALAVEWAGDGIRVNAVAPTYVRTSFIAPLLAQPEVVARIHAATPLGRLAEVEDVAAAVAYLASDAAGMVTGHSLPVDGGYLAQ
jgi:NAD(P)-dependent dehydrogenase (short-subunit alcohol dehydrogenase family)